MASRAFSTLTWRSVVSFRVFDTLSFLSLFIPRLWTRSVWIVHRGHRQYPLFRTVAKATLEVKILTFMLYFLVDGLLLWVVSWVREYSWIKSSHFSVTASDNNAMLVCFHEFIIEESFPLGMKELTLTMRIECVTHHLSPRMKSGKIFECIWKLGKLAQVWPFKKWGLLFRNRQRDWTKRVKAYTAYISIHFRSPCRVARALHCQRMLGELHPTKT